MNESAITHAIGGGLRKCKNCEKVFIQYRHLETAQKLCPTCNDIRNNPASIVQERSVIARYIGLTLDETLPFDFIPVETPDGTRYKLDRRGPWGQIVMWATTPPQPGEVVILRHMRSVHQLRQLKGAEIHAYYVIQPTAKPASGSRLVWVRDGNYPLRIINRDDIPSEQWLSSETLAKLMGDEDS